PWHWYDRVLLDIHKERGQLVYQLSWKAAGQPDHTEKLYSKQACIDRLIEISTQMCPNYHDPDRNVGHGTHEQQVEGFNRFMDQARGVDALRDLGKDRRMRKAQAKEILYHEGDELRTLPLIVHGKVRTFKMNTDGKELVTGLYGPGDLLGYMGLLESGRATETAEMLEAGETALVPREDLLALLYRDRDVSVRFIKLLARDVKEKEMRLLQFAYSTVRQRVAQALLHVHGRYATGDGGLGVSISRDDLAAIVGTATESLIRCLTGMKDGGLIDTHGRDIHIKDKVKLQKLAQG
ncbi:MAG TPA: Crp/Fnr family transcriptional regulator, partial [Flavobacteriales bacterium]|nr:Crp/Fnr family transcriptional regulator [Flavobacteriales bacterium]